MITIKEGHLISYLVLLYQVSILFAFEVCAVGCVFHSVARAQTNIKVVSRNSIRTDPKLVLLHTDDVATQNFPLLLYIVAAW